jgi:hypothetical protein
MVNMMTHKDEDPIGGLMFPVFGHLVVFVLCDIRIQVEEGLRAIARAQFLLCQWYIWARLPLRRTRISLAYGGAFARW